MPLQLLEVGATADLLLVCGCWQSPTPAVVLLFEPITLSKAMASHRPRMHLLKLRASSHYAVRRAAVTVALRKVHGKGADYSSGSSECVDGLLDGATYQQQNMQHSSKPQEYAVHMSTQQKQVQ